MILIKSGRITVGEAARLRGVTRQAMQKYVGGFEPVQARERYIKNVWKGVIKQLTG